MPYHSINNLTMKILIFNTNFSLTHKTALLKIFIWNLPGVLLPLLPLEYAPPAPPRRVPLLPLGQAEGRRSLLVRRFKQKRGSQEQERDAGGRMWVHIWICLLSFWGKYSISMVAFQFGKKICFTSKKHIFAGDFMHFRFFLSRELMWKQAN